MCVCSQPSLLTFPVEQRRAVLAKVWGFECVCARCLKPNASDEQLESSSAAMSEAQQEALQQEYAELDEFVTLCEQQPAEATKPAAEPLVRRCVKFLADVSLLSFPVVPSDCWCDLLRSLR